MERFWITSFALKCFYFWNAGSVMIYAEFCHLFMKQLGFSPKQIGVTSLFGILHLFIPLFLLFGDKFRARKTVTTITGVGLMLTSFIPLLPLLIPLPTCFTASQTLNHSDDMFTSEFRVLGNASLISRNLSLKAFTSKTEPPEYNVPWLSNLFLLMVASKSFNMMFGCVLLSCGNLATMTFLKDQSGNYGAYAMWAQVSGGVSIFTVAMLAWSIRISICGVEGYGYFILYIVSGGMALFAMLSFPWFKFEYDENKTINWSQIKSNLFNVHYAVMFLFLFYAGICLSFQLYWEFWYLDGLDASPLIMGCAALIRRPVIALATLMSVKLINTVGELNTICVEFFLYALSYLALSFTRIPWLVLGIDMFQASAYGLGYCAFMVHFSKAGSKGSSGVIFGLMEAAFAVGFDAGSTLMGSLFGALGTQMTLLIYSMSSSLVLIVFLLYIHFSKRVNEYTELAQDNDEE